MLFTVINIEKENDMTLVTGSTAVGYLKGIWKHSESPVSGHKYNVELHFPAVTVLDISVNTSDTCIKIIGSKVSFTGVCEDIDEVFYIRFSVDALEMLDITDGSGTINKGERLSFSLPFSEIGIFPY